MLQVLRRLRRAVLAAATLVFLLTPHIGLLTGRVNGHLCGCKPNACFCELKAKAGRAGSHCDMERGDGSRSVLRSCSQGHEAATGGVDLRGWLAVPRPAAPMASLAPAGHTSEIPLQTPAEPLIIPVAPPPRAFQAA
jgi:hypothetical protein